MAAHFGAFFACHRLDLQNICCQSSTVPGWHTFFAYPTDACLEWVLGDLDNSGETNVMDILLLSDLIANSEGFGICPGTVSDLNNDGDISVIDVVFLVNLILNP